MSGLRTDRDRFRDPVYVSCILRYMLGIDIYVLSPEMQKQVKEEERQLVEFYKGAFDILGNCIKMGLSIHTAYRFFEMVHRTGGSPVMIRDVLKYAFQFTTETKIGWKFIEQITANSGAYYKALAGIDKKSTRCLVWLCALGVAVHIWRGDYAKAFGEIVKTCFAAACAPAAFLDLLDSIIGYMVPEKYLKMPAIRVVRAMNPVQAAGYLGENLSWIVYLSALAIQNDWKGMQKGIDAWLTAMEKSPLGIVTQLSRDSAMLFDELMQYLDTYVPGGYRPWGSIREWGLFSISIKNLTDYARANPSSY